jgi:uncharacterized protein YbdZ (MbtH family)
MKQKLFLTIVLCLTFFGLFSQVAIVLDKDGDGCYIGLKFIRTNDPLPKDWSLFVNGMTKGDCDDNDPKICKPFKIYLDKDADGCYVAEKFYCGPLKDIPEGWRIWAAGMRKGDCDDTDPTICKPFAIYLDKDGDGCYVAEKLYCGPLKEIPAGWRIWAAGMRKGDCDDTDPTICKPIDIVLDKDADGCYIDRKLYCGPLTAIPAGWRILAAGMTSGDCDDHDPRVCKKVTIVEDKDGDGHYTGVNRSFCQPLTQVPTGWRVLQPGMAEGDCDDGNQSVWRMACVSTPVPGKPKQWTNSMMCVGNVPPPGSWFCLSVVSTNPEIIFTVYPNPVSGRLNITPEENWNERVEMKLVDQFARVVRTLQVPNAVKGQTFTINTADLRPGIYQFTISSGGQLSTKSVAVKL